jgi:serine/threonine protein phosphatase PrpC
VNSENLLKTSIWDELNEALSKEIAKRYVKVARANDVALEQEPSALREQAADEMATSAEIVILRNHEDGEQEKSYVYARLAGDGGLFLISRAGISRKYPTDLELGQVKGPIEALPAAYSNPVLVEGNLAKSETLLLCTDGVADFIEASSKWQKMLRKASALGTMSYRQLVELVLLDHADNQDDKTLILMR